MTKMTLGLQNHWRMANSGVGIIPRDLALAEIRSNTLKGLAQAKIIKKSVILFRSS